MKELSPIFHAVLLCDQTHHGLGGSIETRVSLVWCAQAQAQAAGMNHPPAVSLQVGIRGISLPLLTYRAPGFPLCSNTLP